METGFGKKREKHIDPDGSFYGILGVATSATAAEIKQAYRTLAKKWHPDVNKSPEAEAKFIEIDQAYQTLSDPDKRARYDRKTRQATSPGRTEAETQAEEELTVEGVAALIVYFLGTSYMPDIKKRVRPDIWQAAELHGLVQQKIVTILDIFIGDPRFVGYTKEISPEAWRQAESSEDYREILREQLAYDLKLPFIPSIIRKDWDKCKQSISEDIWDEALRDALALEEVRKAIKQNMRIAFTREWDPVVAKYVNKKKVPEFFKDKYTFYAKFVPPEMLKGIEEEIEAEG